MTADSLETLLDRIFESFDQMSDIPASAIPDIPLYMDQVTSFMDEHLPRSARAADEKLLTKTMINNYTKHRLMPPPEKKKYVRQHLLVLVFIYYYKTIIPLQDIRTLLEPLCERYFGSRSEFDAIYDEVFRLGAAETVQLREQVEELYHRSDSSFQEYPEEEREFLRHFALISSLILDIHMKKELIFRLIDEYN